MKPLPEARLVDKIYKSRSLNPGFNLGHFEDNQVKDLDRFMTMHLAQKMDYNIHMEDEGLESLLLFHKALSDGTRLRIVNLLMEGACCVMEIAKALGISQSRVSQHLNVLRHAGMVKVAKEGTSRRYSLDTQRFPPELFDCVRRAREGSHMLVGDIERLRG